MAKKPAKPKLPRPRSAYWILYADGGAAIAGNNYRNALAYCRLCISGGRVIRATTTFSEVD